VRQNRRLPLIEAALAPARGRRDAAAYDRLCAALALVFGIEALVVFTDVHPQSPADQELGGACARPGGARGIGNAESKAAARLIRGSRFQSRRSGGRR
jgi:hypothetical protein